MSQPTADFGPRLAQRVGPRTAIRRHTGHLRSVGIVSRSSVGFGQAIGRSRQTRPHVTPDNLASRRLRPPAGWWLSFRDAEQPFEDRTQRSWTDDLVPPSRHTTQTRTASTVRPGARTTTPVSASTPPAAAAPPPTGLSRLDALRNMLAQGAAPDGSSISPEILRQQRPDDDLPVERVQRAPEPRRDFAAPPEPAPNGAPVAPQRTNTEAGPSTGPGALARRLQPEQIDPTAAPSRPSPGAGAPASSAPQARGPRSAATPGRTATPATPRDNWTKRPPEQPSQPGPNAANGRPGAGLARRTTDPRVDDAPAFRPGGTDAPRGPASSGMGMRTRSAGAPAPRPEATGGGPANAEATTAPARHGSEGDSPTLVMPGPDTLVRRTDATTARTSLPRPLDASSPIAPASGDGAVTPTSTNARTAADGSTATDPAPRSNAVPRADAAAWTRAPAPPNSPATHTPSAPKRTPASPPTNTPTNAPTATPAPAAGRAPSAADGPAPTSSPTPADRATATGRPTATNPPTATDPSTATGRPRPTDSPTARRAERFGADQVVVERTSLSPADLRLQRLIGSDPMRTVAPPAVRHEPRANDQAGAVEWTEHRLPTPDDEAGRFAPASRLPAGAPPAGRQPANRAHDVSVPAAARPDRTAASGQIRRHATHGRPTEPGSPGSSSIDSRAGARVPLGTWARRRLQAGRVAARAMPAEPRPAGAHVVGPPVAGAPLAGAPSAGAPLAGAPWAGPPVVGAPLAGDLLAAAPLAGVPLARDPLASPARTGHSPAGDVDGRQPDASIARAPALPGAGVADAPVRRVTLPRAMSHRHRPTPPPTTARSGLHDPGDRPTELTSVRPPASAVEPGRDDGGTPLRRAIATVPTTVSAASTSPSASAHVDASAPARAPRPATNSALTAMPERSEAGVALAERFMSELSRSVRARPAPLPRPLQPLAEQIAGRRPVLLSTDRASRRALRAVGKRAATVGDTIHLDAPTNALATPTPRLAEVLAHELTHVAHPSPAPRFFDDIDDSPEERRAESVARTMSRAPLAPAASTLLAPHAQPRRPNARASATGPTLGDTTIRRSPVAGVDATTLAAQITGQARANGSGTEGATHAGTIRRSPAVPASLGTVAGRPTGAPDGTPVVRRSVAEAPTSNDTAPGGPGGLPAGVDPSEWFRSELQRNIDLIVRRVEEQVLIEIERRGGRAWRGF